MKLRAIMFDLDGTLLNSLEDIAAAANYALAKSGYPEQPLAAFYHFVGNGVHKLMEAAVPPEVLKEKPLQIEMLVALMQEYYDKNLYSKTKPYPGILEAVTALHRTGIPLAVLSNKMHEATVAIIAHFFPGKPFQYVAGAQKGIALKPDPALALRIAADMGVEPGQIAYVGDSDVDMHLAKNAGMWGIGAAWGFRGKQELMHAGAKRCLDEPKDILNLLQDA